MSVFFDHINTHIRDNNLDRQLQQMDAAGFVVRNSRVKSPAGMVSGFVDLTFTHLKFLSVVDECAFNKESSANDKVFRKIARPSGLGVLGWHFINTPEYATPGVELNGVHYLPPTRRSPTQLTMGPNTIFDFEGLVLCTDDLLNDFTAWQATFTSVGANAEQVGPMTLQVDEQKFTWINSSEYLNQFGTAWESVDSPSGKIAAIKVLAASVPTAAEHLRSGGFRVIVGTDKKTAYTLPSKDCGFTFVIREANPDAHYGKLLPSIQTLLAS